jgi:hypothetical protein
MDYSKMIAAKKAAKQAQQKVTAEITKNKDEIRNKLIDEVFEFLKLIQLDEAFVFDREYHFKLISSYNNQCSPEEALEQNKVWAKDRTIRGVKTSIDRNIHFTVTDNFMPIIQIESFNRLGANKWTDYDTVSEFADAFTEMCLERTIVKEAATA